MWYLSPRVKLNTDDIFKQMKYFLILISGWILLFVSGCEKQSNEWAWYDLVQFENKPLRDSTVYTFAFEEEDIKEATVTVRIQLVGKLSAEKDRKISIEPINSGANIRFGEHFFFNPDTCYIRKNKAYLDLQILLKRIPELRTEKGEFALVLHENEFFKTTNKKWIVDKTTGRSVDMLKHRVIFSDIITCPKAWKESDPYFGTFSLKKFLLITEVTKYKRNLFNDEKYMTSGRKNYIKNVMEYYFEEYKKKHAGDKEALRKIKEENGVFMQMGKGT